MFTCMVCGWSVKRLRVDCLGCGARNTLLEPDAIEKDETKERARVVRASAVRLRKTKRVLTGLALWDDLLGDPDEGERGAAVPSAILISGGPGVGKTTQAIGAAVAVAGRRDALIVSAEMSQELAVRTAKRARANLDRLVIVETKESREAFEAIERYRPAAVIWDSVQAVRWAGRSGTDRSVKEVIARGYDVGAALGAVTIFVSQVSKDGNAAGPMAVEHLPDVVLELRHDRMSCKKNRFGPAPRELERAVELSPVVH